MKSLFKWPRKISWKLTIVYATTFILVLLILNGGIYLYLSGFVERNARKSLENTLQFVLPKLSGVENFSNYEADILQDISKSEGDVYFRILDHNQEIVAQSNILKGMKIPIEKKYQNINYKGRKFISRTILVSKFGLINGYFQIVRDVTLEYQFLDKLLLILIITSVVGSVGAILTGYFVTRRTLNPINQMISTVRNISISDLGQRLKVQGPEDELNNLARTFNSMLERLEKAFIRQQQFVSDASHELRTPISVIKGYANLLDRWGKNNEEVRDEAIEAIKNEVENMSNIMESLLFLARGDSEKLDIEKDDFWLNELVDEIINETQMINEEISIYSNKNESVKFYGDRKMIKQLLRVFVDNSLKYTDSGGEIIINLQESERNTILSVADTGRGIPAEDIPHIFERFYRVDKSRSDKNGGSGLGLAIARRIIDIHNGEVEVNSTPGVGTEIKVIF